MSRCTIPKSSLGQANVLLEYINKHYVSLDVGDMKEYGGEFRMVLDCIIERMKEKDKKFNECFQRLYFAGSYWDRLKVGEPSEFDVDIVIKLPFIHDTVKIEACESRAFVKVKVGAQSSSSRLTRKQRSQKDNLPKQFHKQQPNHSSHSKMLLKSLIDSRGYLIQRRLSTWMESVLYQALSSFRKEADTWFLSFEDEPENIYEIKVKKSGPALTLYITLPDGFRMDVDLVPVIEFKCSMYQPCYSTVEQYSGKNRTFFIVPKPSKKFPKADNYWRLAFHEQERAILGTKGAGIMKPVCRLLKKLRDNLDMPVLASYYLKTLVMWEICTQKNDQFFRQPMVSLFIHMLEVLRDALKSGRIDYLWDENYNLLEAFDKATIRNCYGRIKNAVSGICQNIETDPLILANYLLNDEEVESLPVYLVEYL